MSILKCFKLNILITNLLDYFKKRWAVFLFIIVIPLTGCSTRACLSYTPVFPKSSQKEAQLKLTHIQDAREKKEVIGSKKNLYGMPIVTIYVDGSVSDWATEALRNELTRAGYSFNDRSECAQYEIQGIIKKAHASSYLNYRGNLIIHFIVSENNQKVFEKTYKTNLRTGINHFASTKQIVHSLERNLQEVCSQFITDLNGL